MEEIILDEVRNDVLERPKPSLDLDYLHAIKKQVQEFADQTNAQLKRNVYQNYSLFIESSREISTIKTEMRHLNTLLEQQQSSINKLMEQLNKSSLIHPNLDKLRSDPFRLELNDDKSEVEAEMLPAWFTKSPEDFDVLIAQRNLREAVDLAQKVRSHFEQYPKCCESNQLDLKAKIEIRMNELIAAICSELKPSTDRSVQGGPRSCIMSIQLLRDLNLCSKAVKLYLDQRSSLLSFVLWQQKAELATTLQYIKQICSIFFHSIIETCNEFKKAFDLDKHIEAALDECSVRFESKNNKDAGQADQLLLFDLVRPIYTSQGSSDGRNSPTSALSGHDASNILVNQTSDKANEHSNSILRPTRNAFNNLATYASLTYWTIEEFENFVQFFRSHVFDNTQLSSSIVAESVYIFRNQCSKLSICCNMDLSENVDTQLAVEIGQIIDNCERKLIDTIKKLDNEEQWEPKQFQNNAQLARFLDEMKDVELKTLASYVYDDYKLHFTSSKTSFARYYLITLGDLAKVG